MADSSETKPDVPATEESSKTTTTEGQSSFASMAANATSGVKENVFSMFGGGPKKEKKEDDDEGKDEPSGSSKAVKKDTEDVRQKQGSL